MTDRVCGYVVPPQPEDIAEAIIDYFENNRKETLLKESGRKRKNSHGIK